MPDDDVELFDGSLRGAGYVLRAAWGPTRWRAGARARSAAYARDGASVWSAAVSSGAAALVELDLEGAPRRVHRIPGRELEVAIAGEAPCAAIARDGRELAVIDLESGRELFCVEAPYARPGLSADGRVVTDGRRIWRVEDGTRVRDTPYPIRSLSRDGALALCVQPVPAEHTTTVELVRVATGALIRTESVRVHAGSGVAWHADGERVAWNDHGGRVTIWHARDPSASFVALERGAPGALHFAGDEVIAVVGDTLVAVSRQGTRRVAVQADVLAIAPDRRRALACAPALGEIDLGSGTFRRARALANVIRVGWDREGRRAIVLRADGDLRVWDVERWTSGHALDPDRSHVVRGPHRTSVAFAGDGSIVVIDERAMVTRFTREGVPSWQHQLDRVAGFEWYDGRVVHEGSRAITVRGTWTRSHPAGYATVDWEDRPTATTLELESGRVLAPPEPDPGEDRSDRVQIFATGEGRHRVVRVHGQALPDDPLLGEPLAVYPSPDERVLLVATDAGQLLRFDRE